MAFIKGFVCRSCGSTLGRWTGTSGRLHDKMCFVCGIGEFELNDFEKQNLDYHSALEAMGREGGPAYKILPRINSPQARLSRRPARERADDNLHNIIRDTSGLTLTDFDLIAEVGDEVAEGMELIIKENEDERNSNS